MYKVCFDRCIKIKLKVYNPEFLFKSIFVLISMHKQYTQNKYTQAVHTNRGSYL